MKNFIIFLVFFNSFDSIVAAPHSGKSQLKIGPTLIAQSMEDEILITYEIPCGANFEGFVVRPNKDTIEIGALLKFYRVSCTGLSQFKIGRIDGIRHSAFRKLFSMSSLKFSNRLKVRRLSQIHLLKHKHRQYKLQAQYTGSCGSPVGFLIKPGKGLKLSYVEEQHRKVQASCHKKQVVAHWKGLRFRKKSNLTITSGESLPFKAYLTPIKASSLKRDQNGHISFRYHRRCHEAPIGPMFRHAPQRRKLLIGMVVARYSHNVCKPKQPKAFWTYYKTRLTQLPPSTKLRPITLRRHKKVDLSPPLMLTSQNSPGHHYLKIQTLMSCQTIRGFTMAEQGNQLLISTVTNIDKRHKKLKITGCARPLKAITYRLRRLGLKRSITLWPMNFTSR